MDSKIDILGIKKLITICILSLIATFNAWYLTSSAYNIRSQLSTTGESIPLACDINSTFSCGSVFIHDFSWIFGIPFPLIALFVYPIVIIVALLGIFGKIKNHFKILFFMGICGFLFNSYFIYHEVLVNTYCLLCLMCTVIIITIAVLGKIGDNEKLKLAQNNKKVL